MPGVSVDQVALARSVDLLTYLQANDPQELKRSGPNEYRTASHGSLVISKGLWYWNHGKFGGRSALDYLIKVCGMGFVDAVEAVLDSQVVGPSITQSVRPGRTDPSFSVLPVEKAKPPPGMYGKPMIQGCAVQKACGQAEHEASDQPEKKLILPFSKNISLNVSKYLKKRCISPEIIFRCLQEGLLYESVYRNRNEPKYDGAAVCVFVGRDQSGKERFACMRGITTDLKRDCVGSDKRFGFRYPAETADDRSVAVFESSVDLLSHSTMECRGDIEWNGHRLSLGGTSDVGLMAFLERNPQIEKISLCLDADGAGQEAAVKIKAGLAADERYSRIIVTIDPPSRERITTKYCFVR